MYDDSYSDSGSALLGFGAGAIIIWLVIVIGFYVWYGWALSRLFTRLGMTGWWGWIPIWNQWQLINRGGYPGWMVLLSGIPVVNFIVIAFTVMSIHRINEESGKGAGFTVLGFFIPPLWATLLGNHLGERMPSAGPTAGYAQQNQFGALAQNGQPAYAAPQQAYAPQTYQTPGQQSLFAPEAPAQQQNPWDQPAPQAQVPATPAQSGPPAPPAPPAPPQPAEPQFVEPTPTDRWGLNSATEREFERLAAENVQAPPAAPLAPQPPQQHFNWPGTGQNGAGQNAAALQQASEPPLPPVVVPEPPQAPAVAQDPEPQQYAAPRYAPPQPPQAAPAQQTPSQQAPAAPQPVPAASVEPAPAQAAPSQAASSQSAPEQSAPAAPPAPAQSAEPQPAQQQEEERSIFEAATPPIHPSATGAAAAGGSAAATGSAAPASAASASAASASSSDSDDDRDPEHRASAPEPAAAADEDDLDRTVVVARAKPVRWELRLQDGQRIALPGDDVIIGRRPVARENAVPLEIPDPSRTLSKSHARLRLVGDSWTIEDLGSTNGVALVNPDGTDLELKSGVEHAATDQLIIGTLPVTLHRIEETG